MRLPLSPWLRAISACLLGISVSAVMAGDWPQWRGPGRDGKSSETGLIENWDKQPPKHLWTIEGMGEGYASVSIAKGALYTTGNLEGGQGVVKVNLADHTVVWSKIVTEQKPKHGYEGSRCTPTLDGELLYVVTSNGQITCLKSADGEVVWTHNFSNWGGRMQNGWGFSESPLVDGDLVLCTPGGEDAMVVALNKKTGDEVWKTPIPSLGDKGKDGAGYSSIVIGNGAGVKQYVTLVGRGVIGIRASDGKYLWGYNGTANGVANIPTVVTEGDYVFTSSGYGTGSALLKLSKDGDGVKAEEVYFLEAKTFENHHGGFILSDGFIYAGAKHNKGFPICVEMKSGDVKWGGDIRPVGEGSAAVTMADGQIIYRYQNGTLALVRATPSGYELNGSFKPVFQERESWSHPVVSDGKLYLREQNKLMCYDLKE
jgi:outer membrane protein assembly factor BamB